MKYPRKITALLTAFALAMQTMPIVALAAPVSGVTVTAASGGTGISVATAANGGTGVYTTLGTITITEGSNNDFSASNNNNTLILSVPSGWEFNPGTGSVSAPSGSISATAISVTSSAATVTFSVGGGNNIDTMTISGLQVRPTNKTALSSANITASGSYVISGITSSTNFGSLSSVALPASQISIAADKTSVQAPGQATLTLAVKDSQNNPVVDGTTVNLSADFGTLGTIPATSNGITTTTLTSAAAGTSTLSSSLTLSGDTQIVFSNVATTTSTSTDTGTTTPPVVTSSSSDASLSALSVLGFDLSPLFASSTFDYTVLLPYNFTNVPDIFATTTFGGASKVIVPALNVASTSSATDRTAKVNVTAEDGTTTASYSVLFNIEATPTSTATSTDTGTTTPPILIASSSDASLSDLSVLGFDLSPLFASSTFNYSVLLPYNFVSVPDIFATTTFSGASKVIVPAVNVASTSSEADRTAIVNVTAEDGIATSSYSVLFNIDVAPTSTATSTGTSTAPYASSTDSSLSALSVDGFAVSPVFASSTFNYTVLLPYNAVAFPNIFATTTFAGATSTIVAASSTASTSPAVDRTATVSVIAEDGIASSTYSVLFNFDVNPATTTGTTTATSTDTTTTSSGGSHHTTFGSYTSGSSGSATTVNAESVSPVVTNEGTQSGVTGSISSTGGTRSSNGGSSEISTTTSESVSSTTATTTVADNQIPGQAAAVATAFSGKLFKTIMGFLGAIIVLGGLYWGLIFRRG